jgi:hypothetical protein
VRSPTQTDPGVPVMDALPMEWLFDCSERTLQDLELSSLDRGAKFLKGAKTDWNAAVSEMAKAEVARYFREHRDEILAYARRAIEKQSVLEFPSKKLA